MLYENTPVALLVTLVNGAILILVQRTHITPPVLISWYGTLLLVTTLRAVAWHRFARANPNFAGMHRWHAIFLAGTACAGAVWGATALFLLPADSMAHQLFVAFVLAGMSAGAISVLSPRLEACLAFFLPALLPLAFHYLGHGSYLQMGMGIMTLLFLAGMLFSALNFHRSIRASLHLRFDKRELEAEVAQRRAAEEQLFMEKDRLQTTLSAIGEGVAMADVNGRIEYLNPAAETLCGYPFHEARNRPANEVFDILDIEENQRAGTAMEESLRTTGKITRQGVLYCNATRHIVEEVATPLYDRHSKIVGAVSVIRDITETQQMTERLAYAADHDGLTGLPNRNLLKDRTMQAIARAQRKQENFALLFLDLDRFKAVNDDLGHAAGDALLRNVAQRLAKCVREEDTIARLGGDEFVVLLNGPTQESHAMAVANKIRESVGQPYQLGDRSASVTVSIGFSLYPANGGDVETLLGYADNAMYRAKQHGRDQVYM
ncbi:diguanylate cyclase [Janthinobacterium sp. 17J80-10]|nr:diguanylate cyclase [Janthinobacterium sp. 17J80-10]